MLSIFQFRFSVQAFQLVQGQQERNKNCAELCFFVLNLDLEYDPIIFLLFLLFSRSRSQQAPKKSLLAWKKQHS